MPSINLSDIQAAADKKFGDFEITLPDGGVITFRPVLRLPKELRKKLGEAFDVEKRVEADKEADIYDIYKDVFRISARQADGFAKLEAVVGDDPAVWQELADEFLGDLEKA